MNKILKKALTLAAASTIFSLGAYAVDVDNDAAVEIVEPITLTANDDMDFGKIFLTAPASTGDITITPAGAVDSTTNVQTAGGTVSQGTVSVGLSSTSSVQFIVTAGAAVDGLTLSNFDAALTGSADTTLNSPSAGVFNGTAVDNNATFNVGATLNVPANITNGARTLAYNVEANYN